MLLIQWDLPPRFVPFPELVHRVIFLNDLEFEWMLVLPRKTERIRVLQRRIVGVLEIRIRVTCGTRQNALYSFECPGCVWNIRFASELGSSCHAPVLSVAQPHTGEIRMLRRRGCRFARTTRDQSDRAQKNNQTDQQMISRV